MIIQLNLLIDKSCIHFHKANQHQKHKSQFYKNKNTPALTLKLTGYWKGLSNIFALPIMPFPQCFFMPLTGFVNRLKSFTVYGKSSAQFMTLFDLCHIYGFSKKMCGDMQSVSCAVRTVFLYYRHQGTNIAEKSTALILFLQAQIKPQSLVRLNETV